MKSIEKKILPKYFRAVRKEEKNFELRKDEDNVQPNGKTGNIPAGQRYVGSGMCFGMCRNMG